MENHNSMFRIMKWLGTSLNQRKMESEGGDSVSVDILHPEILSKEDLIDLLSQRHIKVDQPNATKEDLIEIFHRTITPLPQRTPRSNRRGQATAQVIKKLHARRRLKGDVNEASKATLKIGFSKSSKRQQNTSSPLPSRGISRLKPPPVVTSKLKTIKLNSSPSVSTSVTQSLDPSGRPPVQATKDSPNPATNNKVSFERKKIVFDKSSTQSKSDGESPKVTTMRRDFTTKIKLSTSKSPEVTPGSEQTRKISLKPVGMTGTSRTTKTVLKRTAVGENGKTGMESPDIKTKREASDDDLSPKKKIQRISWP